MDFPLFYALLGFPNYFIFICVKLQIEKENKIKMLLYNTNGTVSEIIVTSIIDGKATSSLATAPTILDSQLASASNAIIVNATNAGSSSAAAYGLGYKTNTNPTNMGYNYLSSATTSGSIYPHVQYPWPSGSAASDSSLFANGVLVSSSKQAEEVKYATNTNRSRGTNYWTTGSTIIPASALNTGSFFVSSSYGLGPANTSAKVSITSSYFTSLFRIPISNLNDVQSFSIVPYNGVISTIAGYNDFSSSTFNDYTQSFVVIHVSASKADMGSVVTSPLVISLGTLQNSSATPSFSNPNSGSANQEFEKRYPTDKTGWTSIGGVLTSPKNR